MPPKSRLHVDEFGFQSRSRIDLYQTVRKEELECFARANEFLKEVRKSSHLLTQIQIQDLRNKATANANEGNALRKANNLDLFKRRNKSNKNKVQIDLHYQHKKESLEIMKKYIEFVYLVDE